MTKLITLLIFSCFISDVVFAEVTPLLQTEKSWNGGDFSYPSGQPEITSAKLSLKPGDNVPFHCHVVPTFGYVIEGKIKVTLKSGESKIFEAGESLVEVFKTIHRGEAVDGPVELVVFYAGAKGVQNTYKEGSTECISGSNH